MTPLSQNMITRCDGKVLDEMSVETHYSTRNNVFLNGSMGMVIK
ncbi:hypothetical protein XBI1_340045 [Xenorhabdus bovienii str. Intermedium]|uniref:Uncharacterized protein n=1 Tax=Xenorhabdus bovienii str. Intermedium TaxID=1379677 RepID=A0A077QMQ2_XENBV|nr:hypothetical protein XBI1_340045 [Xenorhabdus bovienii str. Intermedium]